MLNVERAAASYGIARADRWPTLGIAATAARAGGDTPLVTETASATLGFSSFELDFFGRVRNLSDAALQQYLGTEEAGRSARISLIAEVANAWFTLSADQELQRISEATLENRQALLEITEQREQLGAATELEVQQARTVLEAARADVARYAGQVARDRNALALLVGAELDTALLPRRFEMQTDEILPVPSGLPSEVLLHRPDIAAAEHQLRSANAQIGAARAAMFPSISLTAAAGTASTELSDLFSGGSFGWSFTPRIDLPIFDSGRRRAAVTVATVDRDIALAQYEQAIQAGFREVADALATARTLTDQRQAQIALLNAAERADELSQQRYRVGQDSYLVLLEAQRTLYDARQSLVSTLVSEQTNRIILYRALGAGVSEGRA